MIGRLHHVALLAAALALGACTSLPLTQPAPAPPRSVATLYQQPAERALIQGLILYDQASFDAAGSAFRAALDAGLANPRDAATAHKYLAFIDCAFNRITECEQQFRAAFVADPAFALTQAEIGHPIWGPVYRRVRDEQARK